MRPLRAWLRRFWGTFRKSPRDADMEEELMLHVAVIEEDLLRRGIAPERAARDARVQAGGVAQAMERRRDQRGLRWLEDLIQDSRYGLRMLRRAPLFSAVAIVTLTLAIGANTAVFSILNVLMLRSLPVRDPGNLVQFSWLYPRDPPMNEFSPETYELYRTHNTVFSDIVGTARLAPESRSGGEPIGAEVVTGNFFQALGVRPALGRMLNPGDDKTAAMPVAVVSAGYWKRKFAGDSRVLGASIAIEDPRVPMPFDATVVGVAEPRFAGVTAGYRPDVWVSLASVPDAVRSSVPLSLIARLKPGVSIEQAQDQMRALDRPRIDALAAKDPQWLTVRIDVTPAAAGLDTPLHDQFRRPVLVLMLLLATMLFLACANIGSMLLARGAARQQETAVRISLGAGRVRVARQMLTESLLLAAAGSAAGFIAAPFVAVFLMRLMAAGARALAAVPPPEIPLDTHVLLFAIAVSVGSTMLFGFIPAVASYVSAPIRTLTQGGGTSLPMQRRAGGALVAAQVALSVTLLTISWLYVGHLAELRDRSLGFDRHSALIVSLDTSASGETRDRLRETSRNLLARFARLPGVRAATASAMTPISGAAGSRFIAVPGFDEPLQARSRAALNDVGPSYFATYRTPILAGRDFQPQDERGPRVTIINEALARHYVPARDPVGLDISVEGLGAPFRVVGVVADAKYQDVRAAAPATMYFDWLQVRNVPTEFTLRTSVAPTSLAPDIQRVVEETMKGARIRKMTTLSDQVNAAIVPERLLAMLSGFLGALGALLAAIGLYGLVAYSVTRRTREIGVRVALGATHANILRMVLSDALRLVGLGLALGVPAAFWGQRIAAAMLENMTAGAWWPMLAATAGTILVSLLAALIPARRATCVAPVTALRTE
jgi:predicted permease